VNEKQEHWNRVYSARPANRMSWHQERPSLSLELIAGVAGPEDFIVDVGGGASLLVDSLIAAGYKNLGLVDISGVALSVVRERLGDDAECVRWFETEVGGFRDRQQWDVWHDRAVFHFLTSVDDRNAYRNSLESALKPGGHVVISTFAPDGPDKCSGLEVAKYDSDRLSECLGAKFELVDSRAEMHATPDGVEQSFNYNVLRYTG
jgi:2-polyprenyl-3-methyl-5-hydroxy-6-metoxy-1,4-benzoquinol methylase